MDTKPKKLETAELGRLLPIIIQVAAEEEGKKRGKRPQDVTVDEGKKTVQRIVDVLQGERQS